MTSTAHYFLPTVRVIRTEDGDYSVTMDWLDSYAHSTDAAGVDTYESEEADAAAAALDAWKGNGRPDVVILPTEGGGYGWTGWEAEVDLDNDDDRPGVHYLTIVDPDGEEYATIVHRASDRFPLDGEVAKSKEARADAIVAALNRTA